MRELKRISHAQPSVFRINSFSRRISLAWNQALRNSKFLVDYIHFRDGSISNIFPYTKVKPHCEYDASIIKCTILAKFCSYPLNYNERLLESLFGKPDLKLLNFLHQYKFLSSIVARQIQCPRFPVTRFNFVNID